MPLKDLYSIIGRRIREYRELHDRTQGYISERTGINRATISNIEAGKQQVSILYLYYIARVLETDISSLLPTFKELNISANEQLDILNEKINEEGVEDMTKNSILHLLNKGKTDNDK